MLLTIFGPKLPAIICGVAASALAVHMQVPTAPADFPNTLSFFPVGLNSRLLLGFAIALIATMIPFWIHMMHSRDSTETCIVSGTGCGLPGYSTHEQTFNKTSLRDLFKGRGAIQPLAPEVSHAMLEKSVVEIVKSRTGNQEHPVSHQSSVKLSAPMCPVDLSMYGIPEKISSVIDEGSQAAMAAGLEALRDAGLVKGTYGDAKSWQLPQEFQNATGIIFAASFPALASIVDEMEAFHRSVHDKSCDGSSSSSFSLSSMHSDYSFDRKFLFRVLVFANAQLAEFCKARGPNTQVNGACSGTTQALSIAQDWIRLRRCERVVVIAGDTAANPSLMPWVGNGFRALGVTCLADCPVQAAQPFSAGRSGMVIGSGAVGLVLESHSSYRRRNPSTLPRFFSPALQARKICVLIETYLANSAHHGTALCDDHIEAALREFLDLVHKKHGITASMIAQQGVYMSHETSTQQCAKSEVAALRSCFNDDAEAILIANTKGMTGHPMGVSFEDVVAVEVLTHQLVPPVANFIEPDPTLGKLNVSVGGACDRKFVLRFAAGFGSQVAFSLYGLA